MKAAFRLLHVTAFAALACFSGPPVWSQNASSGTTASPIQGTPLWRGFRFGMSPEEVVSVLSQMPEVKSAKLKSSKEEPKLDVNYVDGGVKIFDQTFQVLPTFISGKLNKITLRTRESCLSYKISSHKNIFEGILKKFPDRISTSDSVIVTTHTPLKGVFADDLTVAYVILNVTELPNLPKVPVQKYTNIIDFQYTLAKAAYDRIAKLRQERLYECPESDGGAYADILIIYADKSYQIMQAKQQNLMEDARKKQEQAHTESEEEKL